MLVRSCREGIKITVTIEMLVRVVSLVVVTLYQAEIERPGARRDDTCCNVQLWLSLTDHVVRDNLCAGDSVLKQGIELKRYIVLT